MPTIFKAVTVFDAPRLFDMHKVQVQPISPNANQNRVQYGNYLVCKKKTSGI